ncbi:hypothetical protein JNW90_25755 [Micromonospora sp. STR1s_5]|nr:hypothetical protein [Micromonospora sp. STR1s_5]
MAWFVRNRMVTGFERKTSEQDLTVIHEDYGSHLPSAQGQVATAVQLPDVAIRNYLAPHTTSLPATVSHYVNVDEGARWQAVLWERAAGATNYFESPLSTYQARATHHEKWNRGVFSPALPWQGYVVDGVSRTGDEISVAVPLYSDGAGRLNDRLGESGSTTLYRDGILVSRQETPGQGVFTVPADAGRYRLVMEGERPEPNTLSTRVTVCWTFRSSHATGSEPTRLPVSVVRFTPALDSRNAAPAGQRYLVPVTVQPLPGSTAGPMQELQVDVSYDDGATWQRADSSNAAASPPDTTRPPRRTRRGCLGNGTSLVNPGAAERSPTCWIGGGDQGLQP